jgi:protein-disulfide isomerase
MAKKDDVLEIAPSTIIIALLFVVVIVLIGLQIFSGDRRQKEAARSVSSEEVFGEEDETSPFTDPAIVEASVTVDLENLPYLGDLDNAGYAIVEFTDFQCPFCQRHSNETFPLIMGNYVEENEVLYVFNDMPIYPPASTKLSLAGLCILEDAGMSVHMNYRKLAYDISFSGDESIFNAIGVLNIDQEAVRNCYDEEKYVDQLDTHIALGRNTGITGVPGFVVGELKDNGKVEGYLVPGAYPFSQFEEVLEFLKNQ